MIQEQQQSGSYLFPSFGHLQRIVCTYEENNQTQYLQLFWGSVSKSQ